MTPWVPMRLPDTMTHWFWSWIARRAPRAEQVRLRHKSIYVLPTLPGVGFLLVITLLWLLGTNYENNLILASAFLLLSLMTVSVVHAFRNLSGLTLSVQRAHPAFAGDLVEFDVLLQAASSSRHEALLLGWNPDFKVETDVPSGGESTVTLACRARRRGWLAPKRLRVYSYYPLGMFRVWSWVHLDAWALVYPAPRSSDQPPQTHLSGQAGEQLSADNQEEFQGFRAYQAGAPMAHVAWKLYARGQGLYLKDYTGYQSEQVWLDWEGLPGLDQESRLSRLCYWALEYGKTAAEYGLRLPGIEIPLGRGRDHQRRVLRALALYGLPDDPSEAPHG